MKFLVIGCGSIGERHIGNLVSLSAGDVLAYDVDSERLAMVVEKHNVTACTDLSQAFKQNIDVVLVCVPPSLHLSCALEGLAANAHLFIEKPLSHTLEGVDDLIERAGAGDLIVCVGYNLRFHPGIRLVKQLLDQEKIGKIVSVYAECGQYLPDWRPWQDYRQSYTARRELGGGIILDGSHELDYVRWLVGAEGKEVSCFAGRINGLDTETEGIAEILLRFDNEVIAGVHVDFVQRAYSRYCRFVGEEGTIVWDYPGKKVKLYSVANKQWQETGVETRPNDMYLEEMKHFIRCIKGEEKPLVDGRTGKRVLEIALAARESAETGRVISL